MTLADLADAIWWLLVAMNPRCSASVNYSQQCDRTDTKAIVFSDRYADFVRACPAHEQQYRDWAAGPLVKIRSGR